MPYITIMQSPRSRQITIDDILYGRVEIPHDLNPRTITGTMTFFVEQVNKRYLDRIDVEDLISTLERFNETNQPLFEAERHSLYHKFYIPKKSGGYREINEPLPPLMTALRNLKDIFEIKFNALYHTAAFAYIKSRCTIDAIKKHQQNESKWFLKTDFSDFFGSTNEEFSFRMLSMIFPFSEVARSERGAAALKKALSLAFLDGGLPQGTPLSPQLTTICMLPIDHRIMNDLVKQGYVYTRYADDILISHRRTFDVPAMCNYINSVLETFNAPFKLKDSKTRYGSSAGNNWNLGVMLNKDNKITIGRKRKLQLRAACTNFIRDYQDNIHWDLHDINVLNGQLSYYKMVEKEYIEGFIRFINEKFNVNLRRMIRSELNRDEQNGGETHG